MEFNAAELAELLKKNQQTELDSKKQSHNLTIGEMKELKVKQGAGEEEMMPANQRPDLEIKAHEKHLVHVLLDENRWHEGTKLSKPYPAKFYVDDFTRMSATEVTTKPGGGKTYPENAFAGLKVEVIHDPRLKEKSVKKEGKVAPVVTKTEEKKLSEMTIEELREKYKATIGTEAQDVDTSEILIGLIEEKLSAKKGPKPLQPVK